MTKLPNMTSILINQDSFNTFKIVFPIILSFESWLSLFYPKLQNPSNYFQIQFGCIYSMKSRPQSRRIRDQSTKSPRKANRQQAETYFKKGKQFQKQGKYLQALDSYMKATICDSNYFQAHCNMGSCFKNLGKYMQAKNSYQRALTISKDDFISHYNLANLQRLIGNYEESIRHYQNVINQHEKGKKQVGSLYLNSLFNLGVSFKNQGRYEEAINIYEKVNVLAPDDEGGYFNHAMCLLSLMERNRDSRGQAFFPNILVTRERASKATKLLDKVQKLNPGNKMISLSRIKATVLSSQTGQKAKSIIPILQNLLLDDSFSDVNQDIYNLIGICKGFKITLTQPQSQKTIAEPRPVTAVESQSSKSINLFAPFEQTNQITFFSQEQLLKNLQNGQLKQMQTYIKSLDNKNNKKCSLQLLLYLHKGASDPKFMDKAYQIYQKKFTLDGVCVSFEGISEQTHKAIGQLLNYKKQYEEAAEHFEYLSNKTKERPKSMAIEHSVIGEGFQTAGNMERALEEYKTAFQLQPDNELMPYNLGCCLMEYGHAAEAIQYFTIFMTLMQAKQSLEEQDRQLYRTQGSILIALCSHGQENQLSNYETAIKNLKALRALKEQVQLQEGHLLNFFVNYSVLLEQKLVAMERSHIDYERYSEELLDIFENMLRFGNCPDRQQVLENAGSLAYSSRQFLKAIDFYTLLQNSIFPPDLWLALCYLQLFEPVMALKHIQQCTKTNDVKGAFIRQVIEWMYFNENAGTWSSQLPKVRDDVFYERHYFGAGVIEKVHQRIEEQEVIEEHRTKEIILKVLKNPLEVKLYRSEINLRFQKMNELLLKLRPASKSGRQQPVPSDIVKICFSKSLNPSQDMNTLINYLSSLGASEDQDKIIESLMYFFIYYNHSASHTIRAIILQKAQSKQHSFDVNLDKIVSSDESTYSIMPDFNNAKRMVEILREWEIVLTPKILTLLDQIQHIYYSGPFIQAIEVQYNFPRHNHFLAADRTFIKFMTLVYEIMNCDNRVTVRGNTISEMQKQIISNYLRTVTTFMQKNRLEEISLSKDVIPLSIQLRYSTKKQTQQFIQNIFKLSNTKPIFQSSQCDEYILIVNKLIKVRCRWGKDDAKAKVRQMFSNIIDNPLDIVNQSILSMQKLSEVLDSFCPQALTYLNQDPSFKW